MTRQLKCRITVVREERYTFVLDSDTPDDCISFVESQRFAKAIPFDDLADVPGAKHSTWISGIIMTPLSIDGRRYGWYLPRDTDRTLKEGER